MFDARSILDILIGGGPGGPPRQGRTTDDPSVFRDMLDQLGDQATPQRHPQGQQAPTVRPSGPSGGPSGGPGGGTSLEDLLRSILTQIQQGPAPQTPPQMAAGRPRPSHRLRVVRRSAGSCRTCCGRSWKAGPAAAGKPPLAAQGRTSAGSRARVGPARRAAWADWPRR